jgi:hypothetical protein
VVSVLDSNLLSVVIYHDTYLLRNDGCFLFHIFTKSMTAMLNKYSACSLGVICSIFAIDMTTRKYKDLVVVLCACGY